MTTKWLLKEIAKELDEKNREIFNTDYDANRMIMDIGLAYDLFLIALRKADAIF